MVYVKMGVQVCYMYRSQTETPKMARCGENHQRHALTSAADPLFEFRNAVGPMNPV